MFRPIMLGWVACLSLLVAAATESARADDQDGIKPLPLTTTASLGGYDATVPQPLTIAQQRARFDADQRMLRMQWNKWIGYEPLRPALPNAMMNNEMNPYYLQPVRYRPVWGVWNHGSRIW
ncbi:MAG: hypothetical protein IT423_21475 [Pirellulaceae bacterium]|nr:hypothetical protein [Pirellulaceae bacterium]